MPLSRWSSPDRADSRGGPSALDYALFFEHADDDERELRRTPHAILVAQRVDVPPCSSARAVEPASAVRIGVAVTLGVVFNFVFAIRIARSAPHPHAG